MHACRNQTLPYEVTYPTQNVTTTNFGTWPILYEGIECPTGNNNLQYHFVNISTVVCIYLSPQKQPCSLRLKQYKAELAVGWSLLTSVHQA